MPFKPPLVPLALSMLLAAPVSALAQVPGARLPWEASGYRYSGDPQISYYDARRTAYDQGYREGLGHGGRAARRGNRHDYRNIREYRRADKGYHRSFGDRERYRQVFRDGFIAGYEDAFSRLAVGRRRGPRQGPYAQGPYAQRPYGQRPYGGRNTGPYGASRSAYYTPAFDNGARDGYEKGLEDARKNRGFDPVRHSWYRSGDRHYRNQYGPRDQYKDFYRRGFQEGYERGYGEGWYR